MSELIIESVPSGAEVQIGGEVVGTTPLTLPITIGLEAFRTECLTNGSVSCEWDVLKTRLEDQTVSKLWWDMTEAERRSITMMAIENIIPYHLHHKRKGAANCMGGTGDWSNAACSSNTMIRYVLFGHPMNEMDTCYYRRFEESDEMCFASQYPYNLPCYVVSGAGHAMCSIQVVSEVDKLSNWIVFQYDDLDIQPGNWQMPHDSMVTIYTPSHFTPCGGVGYGNTVASFEV